MRVEPLLSIRNSDNSAHGFYQLGRYYQGQNRLEKAADAYRTALLQHAGYIDARSALATTYSQQGKYDEAIAEFSSILKMAPQLAHIYNNLGYTYFLQGNYVDAIAAFDKAIQLDPRNPRAYTNLGSAYEKIGNEGRARLAFAQALEVNADTDRVDNVRESEAKLVAAISVPLPAPSSGISVNLDAPAPTAGVALETAGSGVSVSIDGSAQTASPASDNASSGIGASAGGPAPAAGEAPESAQNIVADTAVGPTETPLLAEKALPAPEAQWHRLVSSPVSPSSAIDDGSMRKSSKFRFEIANGNGVSGLAKKYGTTLARTGLPTPRLTNLKPYQQRQTVIEYRAGYYDTALELSRRLRIAPSLISSNALRAITDVRLVLGKDVATRQALIHSEPPAVTEAGYSGQPTASIARSTGPTGTPNNPYPHGAGTIDRPLPSGYSVEPT